MDDLKRITDHMSIFEFQNMDTSLVHANNCGTDSRHVDDRGRQNGSTISEAKILRMSVHERTLLVFTRS